MGHLANILLIYMPPEEVFAVLKVLIERSGHQNKNHEEFKSRLRWYIPQDASDHAQLISTFINCYVEMTLKKNRSLISKCMELQLNFDLIVHSLLNSLLTSVVPIDIAADIVLVFLIEGQKTLFRFIISLLRCNKDYINGLETKKDFIFNLQANCLNSLEK